MTLPLLPPAWVLLLVGKSRVEGWMGMVLRTPTMATLVMWFEVAIGED